MTETRTQEHAAADRRAPAGITSAGAPLRIGIVALTVRDLDAVSQFYRTVIGLRPVEITAERHRLGAGGRALLELRHDPEASLASRRDAGLFHTAFLLPTRSDLADWLIHAQDNNVRLQGASNHLVSEAVYLADPEGNGIEIYRDRPSQEWPLDASNHLEMATLPLDLRDLCATASGRPFPGVPDATVVGHVHLQVGDLPTAEAFYAGRLGLEVTCSYPGATFLGSGGYHHHIGTNVWNSLGAPRRPSRTAGLAELGLVAEAPVVTRMAGAVSGLQNERIVAQDPWGIEISIKPA